jgi:hypothetical protein
VRALGVVVDGVFEEALPRGLGTGLIPAPSESSLFMRFKLHKKG